MNGKRRFDEAIKIASVEAEYRRVALTPCSNCSNRLEMKKQTLVNDQDTGKAYDLLETRCIHCGKPREFLFDISFFFGKQSSE